MSRRIASIILLTTFLAQCAFAADPAVSFSESAIPSGFSATDTSLRQSSAELLITQKNMVAFSIGTTPHGKPYDELYRAPDGLTTYYVGAGASRKIIEKVYANLEAFLFEYNSQGLVTKSIYYGAGDVYSYTRTHTYNTSGQLQSRRLAYATGYIYDYNALNQLVRQTQPGGAYYSYSYNAAGKATQRYYYSPAGVLVSLYRWTYDSSGTLLTSTDVRQYNAVGLEVSRNLTIYRTDGKIQMVRVYANAVWSYDETYLYDVSVSLTGYEKKTSQGYFTYDTQRRLLKSEDTSRRYYTLYDGYYGNKNPRTGKYYSPTGTLLSELGYYDDFRINTEKKYSSATLYLYTNQYLYDAAKVLTGYRRVYPTGIVSFYDTTWLLQKKINTDGSYDVYAAYYGNRVVKTLQRFASSGALTSTTEYFDSGRAQTLTLSSADANGMVYYLYKNENWSSKGIGRVEKARRAAVWQSELSYAYIYDDATGALKRTKIFSDDRWRILLPKTREDFIETGSSYFFQDDIIDAASGYVYESSGRHYTQPTNLGFFIQFLSQVVRGDIVGAPIDREAAVALLVKISIALLKDQEALGDKGLLPWMNIESTGRVRADGVFGQQVSFGDNANLSAAIGSTIGALTLETADVRITQVLSKLETFLDRQQQGYQYLFDSGAGQFHAGWNFVAKAWVGGSSPLYLDRFGSEFRAGLLFVTLRYNFSDSAYQKLQIKMKEYTMTDGSKVFSLSPYDGGAFQVLWPSLLMPETSSLAAKVALETFVDIAIDFSTRNNLAGFLSASYTSFESYSGKIGIKSIAETGDTLIQNVVSLYTLGAAYSVSPAKMLTFMRKVFVDHPELVTEKGLWEGYNHASGAVIQEKIVANALSYVLGITGKGSGYMSAYLSGRGLTTRLNTFYPQGPAGTTNIIQGNLGFFSIGTPPGEIDANGSLVIRNSWYYGNSYYFKRAVTNLAGKKIRIKYISASGGLSGIVSFMKSSTFESRFSAGGFSLSDTGGLENEIIVNIPTSIALIDIDQLGLTVIAPDGEAVDLKITVFEIID